MKTGWIVATLTSVLTFGTAAAQEPPRAHVAQGDLVGKFDGGTEAFLDIPFAAPPLGDRRWKPPAPPLAWSGAREAIQFGPACMQNRSWPGGAWSAEFYIGPPFSEDCLTLNVWTAGGSAKAVLLFIPGGGFTQGGGGIVIYNGTTMARAGIVFVTMNYRLNAAGFLAHPALAAESPDHASGDYALLDVIAALKWIRDNIAAFGGDSAKVTVMGQSAGAAAIRELLHSPLAKELFRGAIIDSGISARDAPLPGKAEAEREGAGWAAAHGAATLAQLRALPAETLADGDDVPHGSAVDGYVLPKQIDPSQPPAIDVPILTGWNGAEGVYAPGRVFSRADLVAATNLAMGPDAKDILALYPSGADATAVMHAGAHDLLMMGAAAWAAARATHASAPLYFYDFEHVMPGGTAPDYGSFHSSELPYVFATLDAMANRPWTQKDREVSILMQGYWLNFIKTGNPNGMDAAGRLLPNWTAFDPAKDEVMVLSGTPHMRAIATPARATIFTRFYDRILRK